MPYYEFTREVWSILDRCFFGTAVLRCNAKTRKFELLLTDTGDEDNEQVKPVSSEEVAILLDDGNPLCVVEGLSSDGVYYVYALSESGMSLMRSLDG